MPLLPLTGVLAAWVGFAIWDRAGQVGLRAAGVRRVVGTVLTVGLLAMLAIPPWQAVYRTATPSTYELAGRYLGSRLDPPEARRFYFEKRERGLAAMRAGHRAPGLPVERLSDVPAEDLERADAIVFFADRLESGDAEWYLRRLAERGGEAHRFEQQLPETWGAGLVVVTQGWRAVAAPEPLSWQPARTAPPASGDWGRPSAVDLERPLEVGEPVSITLRVPRNRRGPRPRVLWIDADGTRVQAPLILTRLAGGLGHYQTAKLDLTAGSVPLTLALDDGVDLGAAGVQADLWRWRRTE